MSHPKDPRLSRRQFLRLVVVSAAAGGATALIGCGDDDPKEPGPDADNNVGNNVGNNAQNNTTNNTDNNAPDAAALFPQGLASGDPKPESVILWTRIGAADGDVPVTFEVATDEAFTEIVASGELSATAEDDHTLRLKVTELEAFTTYFYRFSAQGVVSPVGRTKTAPAPDQDVSVRFAFASCQDFNGRHYHSWRVLAQEEEVDFVVFLGDYVYETANDPRFQLEGDERQITIDEGLVINEEFGVKAALTLNDYRGLYKQHRADADLQLAHARFPFVCIWDDHEFADDSWQDHATHFNDAMGDEKDTARRTAANRAWFEFMPVDLTRDAAASFPDDLQINRSLRFGQHMELVLTDQRSRRDEHIIPEGPDNLATGKFAENSAVGSRNFVLKGGFDPLEADAAPTMLGEEQRQWLIDTLSSSTATWKMWGSETQLSQMAIDLSSFDSLPEEFQDLFYFSVDQWDGYRSERRAIFDALAEVDNLVVLTGDIHAFYASELYQDFDDPGEPVAVEFVTAGISSGAVQEITQQTVDGNPLLASLGLGDLVPRFDEILGATNPHYKFADSRANGVAIAEVSDDAVEVTFLIVPDITSATLTNPVQRIKLRTEAGSKRITMPG